ncbi:protein kinase [Kovacikia minuta CCNUW1]|uniref:WD40 repeat domain-containing serine/threonine-protein kinase n=1 Tax=Kovacikia minuta TaxID=2931930 RepID=UPI001CCD6960|nr:WD40 repeat domain-containing serine/threonine-protein kinase [Kovacikia minuta]UBF28014.1 protein kinase [Kovacikia minuta CCNUW1]
MTFCLNPDCQQPHNPDNAEFCLNCGEKLTPFLRGRYRIIRQIGQGGFGKTYLAEDEDRLRAYCVVKQFSPQVQGAKSLEKAIQLFGQEAVRLYELGEHTQIPTLLAYFEQDKRLYLVQQFIEGQTLQQESQQQGVFGEQKIREVLAGILPILKFIHDKQVIHRDITPSNIIRRKSDNRLMLIDFGVSKLLSAENFAQPGTKIGTEGYAPMEQLRSGKAYPASDIYSLGATCIYLMTQMKPDDLYDPLEGRWMWRELMKHKGRMISEPIAQILDRMLKDLLNDRYQHASDVMKDLRAALSRPPIAANPSAGVPTPMPNSRPGNSGHPPAQTRVSGRPGSPSSPPGNAARPSPSRPPVSGSRNTHALKTLTGHSRWVMAVAVTPDGQTVASAGLDDSIRLWHLPTGEHQQTLIGHTKAINCLTISPDGQTLVSCSDDGTVRIWHLPSGKLVRTLSGHSRHVNSVVISTDGQFLASGSEDRTMVLWKLATGEPLRTFPGLAGMIRAVAISPDGQTLASGGLDNQIKVWSVKTGQQIRTFARGHFNSVNAIAISPDNKTLISGSKDKTIKVWDLSKGEVIRTLTGHTDSVNAIALSPNGKLLVSGSSDKTLRLWNLEKGELTTTLHEHTNSVNSIALTVDGKFLISGSSDNTVKVWKIG